MTTKTARMMGFARYEKRPEVSTEELIDACLTWRRDFLAPHEGIIMHRLLGNTKGQFADAMLVTSRAAFERMSASHPDSESSRRLLELLDRDSIALRTNEILGDPQPVPADFSCIEFGTFTPRRDIDFTETRMLAASRRVERDYLVGFDAPRAYFLARVDEHTYAEVAFVHTLGAARTICNGYPESEACAGLLELFEPSSVDLDFWFVLA